MFLVFLGAISCEGWPMTSGIFKLAYLDHCFQWVQAMSGE